MDPSKSAPFRNFNMTWVVHELNTMSIDSERSREKWSIEIIRKGDFGDAQKVLRQCQRKFMIERVLNIPKNLQIEVCEDFASTIEDVAKCIGSMDGVVPFTCRWFPEVLTTFDIQHDASRNPTGFSPWEECEPKFCRHKTSFVLEIKAYLN